MDNAQIIRDAVRKKAQIITGLNRSVWEYAELGYQETKSAAAIIKALEDDGFTVTKELAGIPTAFKAVWGSGSPVVGILGEYDALPGLSQKAGVAAPEPDEGHTTGHGCGHCALGAGAVGAAMAAKAYLEQSKKPGTLVFFGCPAEEQGFGKGFMAKARCFDGVDMMFTWHPADQNVPMGTRMVANYKVRFDFTGISAHAGAAPEKGRSALDACELMNVGVNYMREHMIDEARVHGAITNPGGIAPNVIPSEAQILYAIRAPKVTQVKKLYERMCDIARGAALITGTTVDIKQVAAYSNVIENDTLEDIMYENMRHFVPIGYTEEELAYARRFQEVITELDKEGLKDLISILSGRDKEKKRQMEESPMLDFVLERHVSFGGGGSTDVGDVSWVVPTGKVDINCYAAGTALHSWQAVAQGKAPAAHKGMLTAAKIMACTGAELLEKPELLERIKEDWLEKLDGETYPEPLPKDVKPEIW